MKTKNIITSLFLIFLLVSCKTDNPKLAYTYEAEPKFTWGYVEFYGKYYSNHEINNNVLSVHLFTNGLTVNDKKELKGTGQYLILEDVFVAPKDSFLQQGTYTVSESGEPLTFFSGVKFEENNQEISSGAYMYYLEQDDSKSKIVYIKEGTISVQRSAVTDNLYTIVCDFKTTENKEIKGSFEARLDHYDQSANAPAASFVRLEKLKYR